MTPDEYVSQILTRDQVDTGTNSTPYVTAMAFKSTAEQWAGNCLRSVGVRVVRQLRPSRASSPAAATSTFCVPRTSNCNGTMKELYENFYDYLTAKKWQVKRKTSRSESR